MRRYWREMAVGVGLVAAGVILGLIAGLVVGVTVDVAAWFGPGEVVAEAAPTRDPRCYNDLWIVAPGDTAWDIAGACFGRDRTGYWAHEILTLNGVDAGKLREGMMLHLPERGR